MSARHPYMFSCGLDKMVKCWDLEQNKVGSAAASCGIRPPSPSCVSRTEHMMEAGCVVLPRETGVHVLKRVL